MQYQLVAIAIQSAANISLVSLVATVVATAAIVAGTCLTLIVLFVKMSAKWTTIEGKQEALMQRVDRLVADKDQVHAAMIGTISSLSDRLWELHTLIRQK